MERPIRRRANLATTDFSTILNHISNFLILFFNSPHPCSCQQWVVRLRLFGLLDRSVRLRLVHRPRLLYQVFHSDRAFQDGQFLARLLNFIRFTLLERVKLPLVPAGPGGPGGPGMYLTRIFEFFVSGMSRCVSTVPVFSQKLFADILGKTTDAGA